MKPACVIAAAAVWPPATAVPRAAPRRRAARSWLIGLLVAAGLLAAMPATADTGRAAAVMPPVDATAATSNARLVRTAFDAWAAGTGSVFDLLHDDMVWTVAGHSPVSGTYASREEFMSRAVVPINAKLATAIRPEVRSLVAQDDTVVVVWEGVATTHVGTTYRNSYAWHMTLAQGRVVRVTAFLDTWALEALLRE